MRSVIPRGFSLKPPDAIHLATAKVWEVDEFHTYDAKLFKFEAMMGFRIVYPHTDQLPLFPTPGSTLRCLRAQQTHWRGYPIRRVRRHRHCRLLPPPQHQKRAQSRRDNQARII